MTINLNFGWAQAFSVEVSKITQREQMPLRIWSSIPKVWGFPSGVWREPRFLRSCINGTDILRNVVVTQISLHSPNLFNRFSWDRGLAPVGGQAAKTRFVTLKRSRLSCKLLHMQLEMKKFTWVVGKKTKTFYKNVNIERSSVRGQCTSRATNPHGKQAFIISVTQ